MDILATSMYHQKLDFRGVAMKSIWDNTNEEFMKEQDSAPGVMQIRWIRKGYPDSILEIHEPGFYGRMAAMAVNREQVLRDGIKKALDHLWGNQLDLQSFKARAFLLAALEAAK